MVSFKDGGNRGGLINSWRDVYNLNQAQEGAFQRALERTAAFNLFDVTTPFGQQTFEGTPGEEGFEQIISLPEQEQALLEQRRQFRTGLSGLGQQQLGTFSPVFQQTIGGPSLADSAGEVERATFQRGQNLLQPEFDRQMSRLENSLLQRGIPRDSDAWRAEMDELSRRQGAQLENLALSSVAAGRGEQSRLIQSDIARRQQMAGELGLFGLGEQPMAPQFQPVPQFQSGAADVMGPTALLQQNLGLENQRRREEQAAGLGGLFDIGAAVISGFPF